jgi:hypothetical protein
MLQISDSAVTRIRSAPSTENEHGNQCFRFVVTGRSLQLLRSDLHSHDVVVYTHAENPMLVLDAATAEFLQDYRVDYDAVAAAFVVAGANRRQRSEAKNPPADSCDDTISNDTVALRLGADR